MMNFLIICIAIIMIMLAIGIVSIVIVSGKVSKKEEELLKKHCEDNC